MISVYMSRGTTKNEKDKSTICYQRKLNSPALTVTGLDNHTNHLIMPFLDSPIGEKGFCVYQMIGTHTFAIPQAI